MVWAGLRGGTQMDLRSICDLWAGHSCSWGFMVSCEERVSSFLLLGLWFCVLWNKKAVVFSDGSVEEFQDPVRKNRRACLLWRFWYCWTLNSEFFGGHDAHQVLIQALHKSADRHVFFVLHGWASGSCHYSWQPFFWQQQKVSDLTVPHFPIIAYNNWMTMHTPPFFHSWLLYRLLCVICTFAAWLESWMQL